MNREQAGQRVLNRMKRKRVGRSGTKAMNVPVNNMSMADKFRLEQRRRLMNKRRDNLPGGMLTGGQAKIAAKAPPTNKIDAKDFAVLRKEKAKGRGQGLQDEKMKPGKIMKANKGGMGEAKGYKKYLQGLKKAEGSVFRAKYKAKQLATAGGKAALRAAKASRVGKIAAGVAGAALLGKAALEKMYEKRTGKKPFTKREPKRTLVDKKMGGGMMMQRPMGYKEGSKGALKPTGIVLDAIRANEKKQKPPKGSKKPGKMGGGMMMRPNPVGMKSGKSVKVKCKLGRNKPTKMY
jgi:hypothetical protein